MKLTAKPRRGRQSQEPLTGDTAPLGGGGAFRIWLPRGRRVAGAEPETAGSWSLPETGELPKDTELIRGEAKDVHQRTGQSWFPPAAACSPASLPKLSRGMPAASPHLGHIRPPSHLSTNNSSSFSPLQVRPAHRTRMREEQLDPDKPQPSPPSTVIVESGLTTLGQREGAGRRASAVPTSG